MAFTVFKEFIQTLKPALLEQGKCTKSFYRQIFQNIEGASDKAEVRQKKQFNLGSSCKLSTPLEAANYLLGRDYKETFLFHASAKSSKEHLFIPDEFVSKLYHKDVSYLSYDTEKHIRETEKNRSQNQPDDWFTKELTAFLIKNQDQISQTVYINWITKIKCLYLIRANLPSKASEIPVIDSIHATKLEPFLEKVLNAIPTEVRDNPIITELRVATNFKKNFQRKLNNWIKKYLKQTPLPENDPGMMWFFHLNMTEISGEMAERWLFEELKNALEDANDKDNIDKTVVLHASDIAIDVDSNSQQQEFDFLLFVPNRKLIVGIEVKRTFNKKTKSNQLQKYYDILEERLSDQLGDGWTYFPVLCVFKPTSDMLTDTRSNDHFIHSETDIKLWIQRVVMNSFPETLDYSISLEQLRNVLKILVFVLQMSNSSIPNADDNVNPPVGTIVESKWVKFVTEALKTISTKTNIIFYSNNQLPIFLNNGPEYQKVFLDGCYGSGKTFLLRQKCQELAARNEVCWYIFGTSHVKKTLLQIQLEEEWKHFPNIRIINKRDIVPGKDALISPSILLDFANKNEGHLFLDEWETGMAGVTVMTGMEELSKLENRFLWFVFHRAAKNPSLIKTHTGFLCVDFSYSMRNSRNIVDLTGTNFLQRIVDGQIIQTYEVFNSDDDDEESELIHFQGFMMLRNFTENRPSARVFPNMPFGKVKFIDGFAKMTEASGILIIMSVFTEYINDVIQHYELLSQKKVGMYYAGKLQYQVDELGIKLVSERECLSYLENGILIVDEAAAEGFEWPVCVAVNPDGNVGTATNMFMRCTTKLYIHRNENSATKNTTLDQDYRETKSKDSLYIISRLMKKLELKKQTSLL